MNSLILFSSHYSSSIATTYSLKFDNSLLVQGVYDIVEDLLSEVLKAESVRCKCANKINFFFEKCMTSSFRKSRLNNKDKT
jgi:hypothetical protein